MLLRSHAHPSCAGFHLLRKVGLCRTAGAEPPPLLQPSALPPPPQGAAPHAAQGGSKQQPRDHWLKKPLGKVLLISTILAFAIYQFWRGCLYGGNAHVVAALCIFTCIF